MRILVTGAGGFLGMAVCQRLIEGGHYVVGIDKRGGPYKNKLLYRILVKWGELQPGESIPIAAWDLVPNMHAPEFHQLDMMKCIATPYYDVLFDLEKNGVDVVIHLAGITGIGACAEDIEQTLKVNVGGTLRVLQWCRKYKVPNFVLVSSCAAEPEAATKVPRSTYGLSKLQAEQLALHFSRLYRQRVAIIRLHALYGPHAPRSNSVMTVIENIDHDRKVVVRHADGATARRAWLWIDDAAEAIVEAATSRNVLIREISGPDNVSWDVLVKQIAVLLGKTADTTYEEMGSEDTESFPVSWDCQASPRVILSTGLARTVDWYRQNDRESWTNAAHR